MRRLSLGLIAAAIVGLVWAATAFAQLRTPTLINKTPDLRVQVEKILGGKLMSLAPGEKEDMSVRLLYRDRKGMNLVGTIDVAAADKSGQPTSARVSPGESTTRAMSTVPLVASRVSDCEKVCRPLTIEKRLCFWICMLFD